MPRDPNSFFRACSRPLYHYRVQRLSISSKTGSPLFRSVDPLLRPVFLPVFEPTTYEPARVQVEAGQSESSWTVGALIGALASSRYPLRGYNLAMTNRLRLPDFGMYFPADSSSPIAFTCQTPRNLFHDRVFLQSHIHDARFRIEEIRPRNKTFRYAWNAIAGSDTKVWGNSSPFLSFRTSRQADRLQY
jgi:hypothetical protein